MGKKFHPWPDCIICPTPWGWIPTTCAEALKVIIAKTCEMDPLTLLIDKSKWRTIMPTTNGNGQFLRQRSRWPNYLKNAIAHPVLNKPTLDYEDLSNYHPTSKLPFLGKMIKKVIATNIWYQPASWMPHKSRFIDHSTEMALVEIKVDLLTALDTGRISILRLLELSIAFDTVDHKLSLTHLLDNRNRWPSTTMAPVIPLQQSSENDVG